MLFNCKFVVGYLFSNLFACVSFWPRILKHLIFYLIFKFQLRYCTNCFIQSLNELFFSLILCDVNPYLLFSLKPVNCLSRYVHPAREEDLHWQSRPAEPVQPEHGAARRPEDHGPEHRRRPATRSSSFGFVFISFVQVKSSSWIVFLNVDLNVD